MHAMHQLHSVAIWPNLELKTRPKELLGSLPLDIALPHSFDNIEHLWTFAKSQAHKLERQ